MLTITAYSTNVIWNDPFWNDTNKIIDTNYSNCGYNNATISSDKRLCYISLGGFDFSSLPSNAQISNITLNLLANSHSSNKATLSFTFTTNNTAKNSYTNINNSTTFINDKTITQATNYTYSGDISSDIVIWANNHQNDIKTNNFNICILGYKVDLYYASITIEYTSSSTIFKGINQIQKAYLGTTPIKKIFLGTKQIY